MILAASFMDGNLLPSMLHVAIKPLLEEPLSCLFELTHLYCVLLCSKTPTVESELLGWKILHSKEV